MRKYLIAGVSVLALSATGAIADEATINNYGGNGAAYIDQLDTTGNATATITQGVDGVPANISSERDTAAIKQEGAGNLRATIEQNTDNNLIGFGERNVAGISQAEGAGSSARATIEQAESQNRAGVLQASSNNDGTVQQTGFNGRALIIQDDSDFNGLDGNSGASDFRLRANAPDNTDNLTTGLGFDANLTNGRFVPGGLRADTSAEGEASNSDATVRQGQGFAGFAENARALVLQSGDNQSADVDQDGFDQKAYVSQEDANNTAIVLQEAAFDDNNQAIVNQTGAGNLGDIYQQADLSFASIDQGGDNNDAFVEQLGERTSAIIDQEGGNNFADAYQTGIRDESTITQSGYNNDAVTYQAFDTIRDVATINQTGDNNEAQILQ